MTKKAYIAPALVCEHVGTTHMLAASGIKSVSGVDGLDMGGNTDDEGITFGNTKSDDWAEIWE